MAWQMQDATSGRSSPFFNQTTPCPRKIHTLRSFPARLLVPFILVTILFPLWGFANDITNPMVAAFKNILLLSNFESSLVQAAFYGGYALMAIPAAIFIKKFSYKKGILIGLALYAIGCLLFIPSGWSLTFAPFLLAYLIMTCGLSFPGNHRQSLRALDG